MKKIILLISLISVLASCGGGGGGGGSAPQTTSATPVMPTPGSTNTDNGNTNGTNNGNNNGQVAQPQNPAPTPAAPQVPTADNRFSKPVDSREITGQGVKVGVLDSDFLSENAKTKELHAKLVNGGFLEGETFAQVINDEFGSRMTAVGKTLGPNSS